MAAQPFLGGNQKDTLENAQQFTDQFMSFGNKKSLFVTELLKFQTLDVLFEKFMVYSIWAGINYIF